MRGKQAGAALGILFDEPHACLARELAIAARERRPLRFRELKLMMKDISQENGMVVARTGVDNDVAGRMPGASTTSDSAL